MKTFSAWISCAIAVIFPIVASMVMLYSDVQSLKVTKVEQTEMTDLKINFATQMTRNTSAIENLNETLKGLGDRLNEQQTRSDRGRDRNTTRADNEMP